MISSSPDRGCFQIECELKRVAEGEKTAEEANDMVEFYQSHRAQIREKEADPEWQKNNMEFDLRSTDWMVSKVRDSEEYAQNLYAAMCNNDFQKLEVIPILTNNTWSVSWRSAGGIVAHMRQEGDYMDWYCSGIRNDTGYDPSLEIAYPKQTYVELNAAYKFNMHVFDTNGTILEKLALGVVKFSSKYWYSVSSFPYPKTCCLLIGFGINWFFTRKKK
jgi:hypothetical protein